MYATIATVTHSYGFDSGSDHAACGKPGTGGMGAGGSTGGRASRLLRPPCDLGEESYCTRAGEAYPWQAVRRFVRENQGLMRRMYGDERHLSVLRDAIERENVGMHLEPEDYDEDEDDSGGSEGGTSSAGAVGVAEHRNEAEDMRRMVYEAAAAERKREGAGRFADDFGGDEATGAYDYYGADEPFHGSKRYGKHHDVDNDIQITDEPEDFYSNLNQPRFLHDMSGREDLSTVLKTKFIYSEQPGKAVKIKDLHMPYFRPMTTSTTTTTTTTPAPTTTTSTTTPTTIASDSIENLGKSNNPDDYIKENATSTVGNRNATAQDTSNTTVNDMLSFTLADAVAANRTAVNDDLRQVSPDVTTTAGDELPVTVVPSSYDDKQQQESQSPVPIQSDGQSLSDGIQGNQQQGGELDKNKRPSGEVLFQDMDNSSNTNKNQNINYNKMRGVNACPVKEEVVAPFWANNTRGEVLALLNLYPFEQYVHWEKCTYEHRQMYCREGCRCEQQYRLHRLLAYDPNNECRGIFSDWFRFPSCCVCKCYDMPAEFRVTSRSPRSAAAASASTSRRRTKNSDRT